MKSQRFVLYSSLLIGAGLCSIAWMPVFGLSAPPFRTLIVGGGPDTEHNQVAIESNVRYLGRLLPPGAQARVLFTDGNPDSKNIQCQGDDKKIFYKKPEISKIDGPSNLETVKSELSMIATDAAMKPGAPVLLYFTGHGSPNAASSFNNNSYDLWNHKELTVRDFASSLKAFPTRTPITVVMVECFSGAFGNLLFEDGVANGEIADLNLCGFFASVAQRPAAGCTPELKEANYRDFSSYFFAALSGVDRLGNKVTGADYNRDGKIGMNEAFAYTLLHDDSIDTPVCTSDVLLRKYVKIPDKDVMATEYAQVMQWASVSQLAALTGLSTALSLDGEGRVATAYDEFMKMNPESDSSHDVHLVRFVRLAKSIVLAHLLGESGDEMAKAKLASLLKAESANPLR